MTPSNPSQEFRFISYLDIMGFKDFVFRNTHSQVTERMDFVSKLVNDIKSVETQTYLKSPIGVVFFSDTIIFYTNASKASDFENLLTVTQFVLYRLLRNDIPAKGAIAYGRFTANTEKSQYFGRSLIDAYELANEVYYYGVILHHSADKKIRTLNWEGKTKNKEVLNNKKVPMKNGDIKHSYVDLSYLMQTETRTVETFLNTFYESASGGVRRYVDNTVAVYNSKSNNDDLTLRHLLKPQNTKR